MITVIITATAMINFAFIIYVILIYVILGISTTFSRFHSLEPFLCDTGIPSAVIAVLVTVSGWSAGPVLQPLHRFAPAFFSCLISELHP